MPQNLDLFPIGNCAVSALIDRCGRFVWACAPRIDSDPVFSALLGGLEPGDPAAKGTWEVVVDGAATVEQDYLRNTPILRTVITDGDGASVEVIDFAPRYQQYGRSFRPTAFIRLIRPLASVARITIRLRPTADWGARAAETTHGSNHIRFVCSDMTLRLSTDGPVSHVLEERTFRLEKPIAMYLGADEGFNADIGATCNRMLQQTLEYWMDWVRGLAVPLDYQSAVIRSAITLKLCMHEETGAIVAAMTTSIPEHADSGRNWDYRYCWLRDAYYVVQALNRLGAVDILENYLGYLRNIVDRAAGGHIQPLFGVGFEPQLTERFAPALAGYRGMGPVRIGNQAFEHQQHDVYGQIILSTVQAFFDERLLRPGTVEDFHSLEPVGERAFQLHDQPDASLWEFRGRANVHTYSAVMCWAACDRLGNAAARLGLDDRADFWNERAARVRQTIDKRAWNEDLGRFAATFEGDELDASLLQLVDLRFIEAKDPRNVATVAAIEAGLRKGSYLLRYAIPDDFGAPQTAFNICTFWLVEALYLAGRIEEARALFEEMLERRTTAGLLSEDIGFADGELWGNYPQTYSLVGLINCAVLLSRPWTSVR
ncbi:glycoside hydrolase family 15 protein [Caulobacter sp. UNC279MFTsu5.1]|uniref:glycoside hydrolase family 15 protein n=1 Tax=Caulobacter sp. UNC279MFTsu5.1 TaxID=1502775 RepID=UPI0008EF5FF3|nr:glycoside hydrolase family 15 protein [Caulobacter sp. UNC279MFTsu5.1]SFJ24588.1 pentatricopeptide repeat domain-containing protein (PPR motif) [Caulobacter sp. UNC279MFTsu5.1]